MNMKREYVKSELLKDHNVLLHITREIANTIRGLDDFIFYENNDDTINNMFSNASEVIPKIIYGDYHITHKYFRIDGCGNIETFPDLNSIIYFYIDFIDDIVDIILDSIEAQKIFIRYYVAYTMNN